MVKVEKITKYYNDIAVVNNISFSLKEGSVIGFLGPNGAGKTTTMRMLSGYLHPDSGNIEVLNHNIIKERIAAQKHIGYLPEAPGGFNKLTVREFLTFCCQTRAFNRKFTRQAIDYVCSKIELESVLDKSLGLLSKGWKQRAWLAQAIIHDPPILLLDEPTDGLDPNQKDQVRKIIKDMSSTKVILITTHILDEIEELCEQVIIISNGRIVEDSKISNLMDDNGRLGDIFRKLTNP